MNNQPLDRGRVSYIAEKYQTGSGENKNRYATIGRATKWPSQNGGENIQIEIDTMPIGHTGPLNCYIFWNSENDSNGQQPQQNGGFQQQAQQQGQQPPPMDPTIPF